MTYDDRDRRDPGDADGPDQAEPVTPSEGAQPATPEPQGEPTPFDAAPSSPGAWPAEDGLPAEEPAISDATDAGVADTQPWKPASPARQIDATPAESVPPADTWQAEPPVDMSTEWPTAGAESTEPDASVTQAWVPAEPVAPAEPAAHEPPPREVEAYGGDPAAATAAVAGAHSVPESGGGVGESTQCPRCGTENRPGLAFCRNCGQRLVVAGMAATVERPGTPEGTQACPRCGTHNRTGVAFCQNCGANLRAASAGYVPPAVAGSVAEAEAAPRRSAVLGPVVLLIGIVMLAPAYLLPFAYGAGSLSERALGPDGYGLAFWSGYPDVSAAFADQVYFGLAAPTPILGVLLLGLAVAGFIRAEPGALQRAGLAVSLVWSLGLIVLFLIVELAGNWGGDIVALLRVLTPAGIIFFLAGLIILIGSLTRLGRS